MENEIYKQKRVSLFPQQIPSEHIADLINEAYKNKKLIDGDFYEGTTASGIIICMYLNDELKIKAAFPKYTKPL